MLFLYSLVQQKVHGRIFLLYRTSNAVQLGTFHSLYAALPSAYTLSELNVRFIIIPVDKYFKS